MAIGVAALAASGRARAQLAAQYFPSDIPGYGTDMAASVITRELEAGETDGVEVGSFVVRPSLSESLGYSSSTLGTPNSGSSELETSAGVRLNSDWTRNAIGASFNVDDRRYLDVPVASYTNWTAATGGSLKGGSDTATLSYAHLGLNLSATSFGVYGVVDPVPYSVDDVRLGYSALRGRFSFQPTAEFENFSFGSAGGGDAVSYATLSHRDEVGALATRYELSTGNAAVVILRGSGAQFTARGAGGNDYQDVTGYVGLDFRSDSLIQYRLLVGGERRSFDAAGSSAVSSPAAEADVVWLPRRTDTVTFDISRHLDDPESPFARDQTVTTLLLRADHELTRTIFLTASGSLGWSDSQAVTGAASSTTQMQEHFNAGAEWKVNRFLRVSAYYGYTHSSFGDGVTLVTTASGSSRTTFTSNSAGLNVTVSR